MHATTLAIMIMSLFVPAVAAGEPSTTGEHEITARFDANRWASRMTPDKDVTYTRIILPWLKKNNCLLPSEGDGLLVVYQPWGIVEAAALYIPKPGGGGTLSFFGERRTDQTSAPDVWTDKEWESVKGIIAAGKFFNVPYRNAKMGCDGSSVYIEARIDGRHHLVCHWSPDEPVVQRLANLIGRRPDYYFPIDRATPGAAWQAVGMAAWAGSKETLAKASTERGCQALLAAIRGEETTGKDLNTWAQSWANHSLTFTSKTDTEASARLGPKDNQASVKLVKTTDGWKMDGFVPAAK